MHDAARQPAATAATPASTPTTATTPATNAAEQGPAKATRDPGVAPELGLHGAGRASQSEARLVQPPCHGDPDPAVSPAAGPATSTALPPPGAGRSDPLRTQGLQGPAEIAKYVIKPGSRSSTTPCSRTSRWTRSAGTTACVQHAARFTPLDLAGSQGSQRRVLRGGRAAAGARQIVAGVGGGQNLIYDNPPGGSARAGERGMGRIAGQLERLHEPARLQLRGRSRSCGRSGSTSTSSTRRRSRSPAKASAWSAGLGLSVPPGREPELTYEGNSQRDGASSSCSATATVDAALRGVAERRLIYDSWDWMESVSLQLRQHHRRTRRPTAKQERRRGQRHVTFKAGDKSEFSCFIENSQRPDADVKNELDGGEMCNLWGSTVGEGTRLRGSFR